MYNIELLEPINDISEITNSYIELIDDIDTMQDNYKYYVLDNFEFPLNGKDLKLLDNKYLMSLNESNFIKFISEVFKRNNNLCIIDTNLLKLEYHNFLGYLNYGIDIKYQYILLHQYIKLQNISSKYFYVRDIEILNMFIIFGLREYRLNNFFFFPKDKSCFLVNYDQVFPVFFKNKNILKVYTNIANNNNLYIR